MPLITELALQLRLVIDPRYRLAGQCKLLIHDILMSSHLINVVNLFASPKYL